MEDFFGQNFFFYGTTQNFINLGKVHKQEETLQQRYNVNLFHKIDLQNKLLFLAKLKEHRVEMYDDRLNLMGLSKPKELQYFNTEENLKIFPISRNKSSI